MYHLEAVASPFSHRYIFPCYCWWCDNIVFYSIVTKSRLQKCIVLPCNIMPLYYVVVITMLNV